MPVAAPDAHPTDDILARLRAASSEVAGVPDEILDGSWQPFGSCAQTEHAGLVAAGAWFPPPGRPALAAAAVAVCQTCPVQPECAVYALAWGITTGIWGGVSAKKRARFRNHLASIGVARTFRRCAHCGGRFAVLNTTVVTDSLGRKPRTNAAATRYCCDEHRVLAGRARAA